MAWKSKEAQKKYNKQYYLDHQDKIKEIEKAKYWQDPEVGKERARQYRLNNPEKISEQYKATWQRLKGDTERNRQILAAHHRRYKSNPWYKKKMSVRRLTHKKWGYLLKEASCVFCNSRGKLHLHHIIYEVDAFLVVCTNCHKEIHKKWRE